MMQPAEDDDEIFVYMGGDQEVPDGVRRARIHLDVKIVRARAFYQRRQLIHVEFHDGIEIVESDAFRGCFALRGPIGLLGVKIIKDWAFYDCRSLTGVEFGNKLETIEMRAFNSCSSLTNIRMPSVRTIGSWAFAWCYELSDVECGEGLRRLQEKPFLGCRELKRIALPLKSGLIGDGAFGKCLELAVIDLVGGIHNTVASLHMESWKNEMNNEINRINQVLPNTDHWGKTEAIQRWMESTAPLFDHYKTEQYKWLKEVTTLLELALWKANLDDNLSTEGIRMTRRSRKRAKKETYVNSGAYVVIKNVLPFL